jgi:hypothetical protein
VRGSGRPSWSAFLNATIGCMTMTSNMPPAAPIAVCSSGVTRLCCGLRAGACCCGLDMFAIAFFGGVLNARSCRLSGALSAAWRRFGRAGALSVGAPPVDP